MTRHVTCHDSLTEVVSTLSFRQFRTRHGHGHVGVLNWFPFIFVCVGEVEDVGVLIENVVEFIVDNCVACRVPLWSWGPSASRCRETTSFSAVIAQLEGSRCVIVAPIRWVCDRVMTIMWSSALGISSSMCSVSFRRARRRDNASGTWCAHPLRYKISKSNSRSRSLHRVSLPEGSVSVISQRRASWSVRIVNRVPSMYGRRVVLARTTAKHSRSVAE